MKYGRREDDTKELAGIGAWYGFIVAALVAFKLTGLLTIDWAMVLSPLWLGAVFAVFVFAYLILTGEKA